MVVLKENGTQQYKGTNCAHKNHPEEAHTLELLIKDVKSTVLNAQ